MGISKIELDRVAASTKATVMEDYPAELQPSFYENPSVNVLMCINDDNVKLWVDKVNRGIKLFAPELCEEGVGGTYVLKDEKGNNIAIFKPEDEEAFAANNPKPENQGQPYKNGVIVGEAASKEVAAYLLDQNTHFSEVPVTVMVNCTHKALYSVFEQTHGMEPQPKAKVGSLQMYVPHDCQSWDMGPSIFPVSEVHKIGLLDCRILNLDRHGGNILVQKMEDNSLKLHPIDHGYSFPHSLGEIWFEWLTWPQAKVPFSEAAKAFVDAIDIEEDIALLRKELHLHEQCLDMLRLSTMLLKKAVAAGWTLYEIGFFICRPEPEKASRLEDLHGKALSRAQQQQHLESDVSCEATPAEAFYGVLSRYFDSTLQQQQ
jgi:phosphatidylinositol 4-kinase type 2